MDLNDVEWELGAIRERYHELERQLHGFEWTVEEDALAFLTDAGIVGRLAMAHEGCWPSDDEGNLPAKIGECVWWLAVLAEGTGCDFGKCVESFLGERLDALGVGDAR